ncbi:MAG TPA: cupin domain-containing protein [Bradyrhizobium sp.]|nr:cupin domain-containing protein [Bradyrhizobium sp.]
MALIEVGSFNVDLEPSPIEPSWIIEGNPVARSRVLSTSEDRTAQTIVWQCTEGRFNWYYDIDETIMIMEGSIVLESEGMPPKRYGPGDVIFFRDGAHAKWHVEGHVKKIAFCRKTNPVMIGFLIRVVNKLKKMFLSTGAPRPASLMGAG